MTPETGTYRWMAPEVIQHGPYDHKVDVELLDLFEENGSPQGLDRK